MKESVVEQYLVKRVRAMGGKIRKVKWIGTDGAPDRFVMLPYHVGERPRFFWAELKSPTGALRFAQIREHAGLREMGQPVFVLRTAAQVDRVLNSAIADYERVGKHVFRFEDLPYYRV